MILGHYSVSFTLDTYTHVLDDHKREGMALMDGLFAAESTELQSFSYAVVITPLEDGTMRYDVQDFPEMSCVGADMTVCMQQIRESLQEELLVSVQPIMPTNPATIVLQPGQFVLQIPV